MSGEARPSPEVSIRVESNVGGFAVTICVCGALLATGLAWGHIDRCDLYAEHVGRVES